MDNEDKRKGIHIINGLWVFILPFFPRMLAIVVVLVALVFVFILARPNSPFGSFFKNSFQAMARNQDKEKGFLIGPSLYVIMVLLLVLFTDYRIAGALFAVLAFGDGFATVFGRKYGKHKLSNGKSVEGSIAFFTFSLLSSLSIFLLINEFNTPDAGLKIISPLILPASLNISPIMFLLMFTLINILLTLIELFIGDFINDNVMIPISGCVLFYLSFFLILTFHVNV